jgi:hypothetical protein
MADSPIGLAYVEALNNHFLEFLWIDGIKPPVVYIIQSSLIQLFGEEAFLNRTSTFYFVGAVNSVGLYLLFRTAVLSGARPWLSVIAITGLAVALGQFSFWRLGAHYDHLSFATTALFLWAAARFLRTPNLKVALLLGIAGMIVVLHNTVFAAVIPVALTFAWLASLAKGKRLNVLPWVLVILLPVLSGLGWSAKIYATKGVFAPSTLGGMAKMLVTLRTVDRDTGALLDTARALDMPDWWIWCFENAIPFGSPDETGVNVQIILAKSAAAGMCTGVTLFEDDQWPLDFDGLRASMEPFGNPAVLTAIDADILDTTTNRLQQVGFSGVLKLHWTELYTVYGSELHDAHRSKNWGLYLKTYLKLAEVYAISEGPRFPDMVKPSLGDVRGSVAGRAMTGATFTFGTVMQIVSPLLLLFSVWRLGPGLVRCFWKHSRMAKDEGKFPLETLLCAALLVQFVLFVTLVGEENGRYYIYALPYSVLLVLVLLAPRAKAMT